MEAWATDKDVFKGRMELGITLEPKLSFCPCNAQSERNDTKGSKAFHKGIYPAQEVQFWFSVHLGWIDDGFWSPFSSGCCVFRDSTSLFIFVRVKRWKFLSVFGEIVIKCKPPLGRDLKLATKYSPRPCLVSREYGLQGRCDDSTYLCSRF